MPDIEYRALKEIAYEAGLDPDEEMRTKYSGRGMYGRHCVAFDLPTRTGMLTLGAAIVTTLGADEGAEMIERAALDSMGLGFVVYFPGITCDDAPEQDEDEDSDDEE